MMPLFVDDFLKNEGLLIDVRSPCEFRKAKIPGAINLPLFTDEERKIVGTIYKTQGKQAAIDRGLLFTRPKLSGFIKSAHSLLQSQNEKLLRVYCARGGMRSRAMTYLFQKIGIKAQSLLGGYKRYRQWALQTLNRPWVFIVIGGKTGSGKTEILHLLSSLGEQIVDLERHARHRGSVFGMLEDSQPSCEQFENEIAFALSILDASKPIWIEDESRMIGSCKIPDSLYEKMKASLLLVIQRSKEERVLRLKNAYGHLKKEILLNAAVSIKKRLGVEKTKCLISAIEHGLSGQAIKIVLDYYDAAYQFGLEKRNEAGILLSKDHFSDLDWAHVLIEEKKRIF